MTLLLIGIVIFLGVHLIPALPEIREQLIERLGKNLYRGLFSAVSALGFVLIVWGFARAPFLQIWPPPAWTRHVAMLLILPVFILIIAAYLPGKIKETVKHPFLIAIKTWALAHLIANGDVASIILFGSFLAYAVIDRVALKHRAATGLVTVGQAPDSPRNDIIAVAGGLVFYLIFLVWLHPLLIGVPVLRPS
jgi:uncharacterized membrane protein